MAKLAPGWTILTAYVLESPEGKLANYTHYREVTGLCEVCGKPMATHAKCKACSILSGPDHFVFCSSYCGYQICGYCRDNWERLDRCLERETTWLEFLDPKGHTAEIVNSRKVTSREIKYELSKSTERPAEAEVKGSKGH